MSEFAFFLKESCTGNAQVRYISKYYIWSKFFLDFPPTSLLISWSLAMAVIQTQALTCNCILCGVWLTNQQFLMCQLEFFSRKTTQEDKI